MSGLQFEIPQEFTYGIDVPTDTRLNAGSLVLLEPARDSESGIPSKMVNYASDQFLNLTGFDTAEIELRNTINSLAGASVERTAKGGIHCIFPSSVSSMVTRACFSAVTPQSLIDYVNNHLDHDYYFSLMGVITRDTSTTAQTSVTLAGFHSAADGSADNQLTTTIYQTSGTLNVSGGPNTPIMLGRNTITNPNSPFITDIGRKTMELVPKLSTNNMKEEIFCMGALSPSVFKGLPSWVLYSIYMEDLTVSGQTYEQAHDKSQAVFDSRFGQGGIYSNDVWTTPV